jgi:hypothetical protein
MMTTGQGETMTKTSYEVNVTPSGFAGLSPVYEVTLYVTRQAGVCGPVFTGHKVESLSEVDEMLDRWGFDRTSGYGPVCANGFATATVERQS